MLLRVNRHFTKVIAAFVASAVVTCLTSPLAAAIRSVGSVNPVPPAAGGTFTGQLVVGDEQAASNDIRAWLQIDAGSILQYGTLIVGDEGDLSDDEVFYGEFNIIGNFPGQLNDPYTRFNLSGTGSDTNPTAQIGRDGYGRLLLSDGATMTLTNTDSNFSIGVRATGVGNVTVTDPFTILTIQKDLVVGQAGIGTLQVLDGALVRTVDDNIARNVYIGRDATGVGTATVDGAGSILRAGNNLVVGGAGQGTLIIGSGAIVDADNTATATTTVGTLGRIELRGGTLLGTRPDQLAPITTFGTTVNGYLGGAGLVRSSVDINAAGRLEAGAGEVLRIDGEVSNEGAITVEKGELRFLNSFAQTATGRITLEDGTIRFSQPLVNNGVISSAHGATNIHGLITNEGTIVVASDTVATFNDEVDNNDTITVLPRGNALFLGDMTFQAASALALAVGLDDTTNNSAQIAARGAATLDGTLTVSLVSGYTPALGDRFELLTAGGGIAGTFDTATLPDIPGNLEFGLLYGPTSVVMEARFEQNTINLPGDYNNNGIVDAADYVVWRDQLGNNNSLPNDDSPGVGQDDYSRWRANFGLTAGSGANAVSGAPLAAPEPASVWIALLAMPLPFIRRRDGRR